MSTKLKLWWAYNVIFVIPLMLYIVINGYWWLFDGNVIMADKMSWAVTVLAITGFGSLMVAVICQVFKVTNNTTRSNYGG